jgi:hypothetical protein
MKAKPSDEETRFQNALRQVLTVSKSDLTRLLAENAKVRRQRKRKPGPKPGRSRRSKTSASDPASSDKG